MNFLQINIKSLKKKLLDVYSNFLINLLKKLNIKCFLVNIPKKKKKLTLLKSPHVYKKAWEHFKLCSYKKIIFIKNFKNIKNLLINKPKLINITVKSIGK